MSSFVKNILKRVITNKLRFSVDKLLQRKFDLHWTLRSGLKVAVATEADWIIYNDIFVDGEYDAPIMSCLHGRDPAGRLNILDLGANVGFFGLRFVDLMRQNGHQGVPMQITMVEGAPSVFAELQKRLATAGDLAKEITAVNGLVGRRGGTGRIREGVFHPNNNTLHSGPGDVQVGYVDLTTLIEQPSIDLLKCDVEGAELQFIENYPDLLKNVKSAVFELHPQVCDYERCIQLLEDAGLTRSKVLRRTEGFVVIHVWR